MKPSTVSSRFLITIPQTHLPIHPSPNPSFSTSLPSSRDINAAKDAAAALPRPDGASADELHGHMGIVCDITCASSRTGAIAALTAAGFRASILVNNAGATHDALLLRLSEEDVLRSLNVNLVGSMMLTKEILRDMLKLQMPASIVNIGSVVGAYGNSGQCAYGAAKAGLLGFTKSLAKEVGKRSSSIASSSRTIHESTVSFFILEVTNNE